MKCVHQSKWFSRLNSSLTALIALATLILSLLFFDAYIYDVLAYHGPFSVKATHLKAFLDFQFDQALLGRYQGFAPLWRFALYPSFALGLPRLLLLPNLLILALLCLVCQKLRVLPWHLTTCAIFVFPISLFSFRSGYQDFFVGASVSAALILLLYSIYQNQISTVILSLILAALASYTKYQGLIQAVPIVLLGYIALLLSKYVAKSESKFPNQCFAALTIGLLVIGSHSIFNLLVYSNPFHPISVGPFEGSEANYTASSSYTSFIYPLHGFVNHFLSASELDWIFRGVVPYYNIDMARSQTQYGGLLDPSTTTGLVRTGGTYAPAYLAVFLIFVVSLYQKIQSFISSKALNNYDFAFILSALYVLVVALMPQSHELRYYLSIPMVISIFALSTLYQVDQSQLARSAVLALMTLSLVLNFTQPVYSTFKTGWQYAINYPSRDLPDVEDCNGEYLTNSVNRFACKLVQP